MVLTVILRDQLTVDSLSKFLTGIVFFRMHSNEKCRRMITLKPYGCLHSYRLR